TAGGGRAVRARHHRGHQCRPRAEGCGHRHPRHRWVRGRARAGAPEARPHVRPRHGPGDADVPGPASPAGGGPARAWPRPDARGRTLVALDEDQVRAAVARLRDEGVQAIAVCYLFSFVDPVHERRTRELIAEVAPGLSVSLSSEVDPTFREYERTCVTAFDA